MEKKFELNNLDIVFKNSMLFSVMRTLESDRKRIAHELHDDISSKLNVISLNCHLLKIPNLSATEREEIMKNIIDYTSKALNSSKKMAHSLLPPVLDKFGLHAGIEELCSDFSNNESVTIEYENKLKFNFEENESHIHIFRILQELLANSIQHGKATAISVLFDKINGKRTCIYSDNGIGFDLNQIENHSGFGMKNIASRIVILQGNIKIESELNNGVSVIFNF
ncbi:sensor histidine kinase [Flavobacterium sp. ZT3R18]|uniref:sensor histidine kinase n=1 Tax=Flavobacterium sp. ZT3R18 TaxID=2594429 RepID=UPI00117A3DB7|nr:ATP-binding protein [Flavobacterium sp. ZT3R18]TRX36406.1 sensor histidine kinase [Flavobacterium sp. ZT3R18]